MSKYKTGYKFSKGDTCYLRLQNSTVIKITGVDFLDCCYLYRVIKHPDADGVGKLVKKDALWEKVNEF